MRGSQTYRLKIQKEQGKDSPDLVRNIVAEIRQQGRVAEHDVQRFIERTTPSGKTAKYCRLNACNATLSDFRVSALRVLFVGFHMARLLGMKRAPCTRVSAMKISRY